MRIQKVLTASVVSILVIGSYQNCSPVQVVDQTLDLASVQAIPPVCQKMTSPAVLPEFLYSWDHSSDIEPNAKQVMAAPVVGDLDGDKIPEIVFVSYYDESYEGLGVLRVLNGKDGSVKFSISSDELRPYAATTPLLIDIDGNGKAEIIFHHYSKNKMIALNFDGSLRWSLDYEFTSYPANPLVKCFQGFAAADLNQDGKAEILAGGFLVTEDARRIPRIQKQFSGNSCTSFAASLDTRENTPLNIINSSGVYDRVGNLLWSFPRGGQVATANLMPEIPGIEMVIVGGGYLSIYSGLNGATILEKKLAEHSDLICTNRTDVGGGQATIGDFDGDPTNLEIAVATGRSLTIFDKRGEILAGSVTKDCSSLVTGVTSFDFNGDGKPEIIYGDEQYMRIYEMNDSKELKVIWSTINPSGTLFEYPVVADVDGSGEAKLVVVANNMWVNREGHYSTPEEKTEAQKITGLRVFGPKLKKAWMPTRALWNQYAYYVSNVQDNLRATSTSILNGFAGNAFKRNVQAGMFQDVCRQ